MDGPHDEYPSVRVFNTAERMRTTLRAGITSARDLGATEAGFRVAQERGLIDGPRLQVAVRLLSHTGGHLGPTNKAGYDVAAMIGEGHENCDTGDEARSSTRRVNRDGAGGITAEAAERRGQEAAQGRGSREEDRRRDRAWCQDRGRHRRARVAARAQP